MKSRDIVGSIGQGTVIDHIPADAIFKVVEILKLAKHNDMISIGAYLQSKKMGSKAILKVEKRFLTDEETNKIAVLAPLATVSIIKSGKVSKKTTVKLAQTIEQVIKCSNPNCITNHEPGHSKFNVISKNPVKVKCNYCERVMNKEDITIL